MTAAIMPEYCYSLVSTMSTFGEALAAARTVKGWNKRTLALASGKTPTTITDLESGKRNPSRKMVTELAGALECDPAPLLTAAGFMPSDEIEYVPDEDRLVEFLHAYEGNDPRLIAAKAGMMGVEGYLKALAISEEVTQSVPPPAPEVPKE